MNANPSYQSTSSLKSLWQSYYEDRLEFVTHLGTMRIPFESIEEVRVEESDVTRLLHGDLQLKNFRPALKLDWANFLEHVIFDKSDGYVHRIFITPDDIRTFKSKLDAALAKFHAAPAAHKTPGPA